MDEHLEIIKRKKCLRTDSKVTMRLLLSIFLLPRFRTRDESAKKVLSTPYCINENENFVGDEYNIVEQFLER